jgi:hypothetical protein
LATSGAGNGQVNAIFAAYYGAWLTEKSISSLTAR